MHRRTLLLCSASLLLSGGFGSATAQSTDAETLLNEVARRGQRIDAKPEVFEKIGGSTGNKNVPITHIQDRSGDVIRMFGRLVDSPNDYFFIWMTTSSQFDAPVGAVRMDANLKAVGEAAQSVKGVWSKIPGGPFVATEMKNWKEILGDLSAAMTSSNRKRLLADIARLGTPAQFPPPIVAAMGMDATAKMPTTLMQARIEQHALYAGSFPDRSNEYYFVLFEDGKNLKAWTGAVRFNGDFKPIGHGAESLEGKWKPMSAAQTTANLGLMMRAWTTVLSR